MVLLSIDQRLERLRVRLRELAFWRWRDHLDLGRWTFEGRPLGLGRAWPDTASVAHLRHPEAHVPSEWPLEDCRLELDVGGEGTLRIEYADGTHQEWGIDTRHFLWRLRRPAFSLSVEAVARLELGRPNPDAALARARIVWMEESVVRLERQLSLIVEAAEALGDAEVTDPLIECAERALASLEWPSATEPYLARSAPSPWLQSLWTPLEARSEAQRLSRAEAEATRAAAEQLEAGLEALRQRYPHHGAVALTGHAHLDVAWLWPLEETRRKARRTLHTAAGLLDDYEELTFNQSSAQIYSFVQEDDPELFERIREHVAGQRWEPVGGMWVEPDVNMPCGESLVRQLLYGQRYFRDNFGATHEVCWLPDCFGFSPGLPQLLLGAGIGNFVTIKVNWSETNKLPHDLFWWEGLDGSRVLAHTFDNPDFGYNGQPGPRSTVPTWTNFRGKHRHHETLLSVGYGDGGGGVTAEMMERARILASFPALPSLRFARVHDFFEEMRSSIAGEDIPTWVGELYLEYHRGTLTTQGKVKWLHRRAERDLLAAETVAAMNAVVGEHVAGPPEHLWRALLRNQFHDILPGSGVREIYEDAERELRHVVAGAAGLLDSGVASLRRRLVPAGEEHGVLLVNPDLSARPVRTFSEQGLPGAQRVDDGFVLTAPGVVPGVGARVALSTAPAGSVIASPEGLENDALVVRLGADGTLDSVYDKRAHREVLAHRGNQIWAYVDKPRAFDAWEIDVGYTDSAHELVAVEPPEVVESGPHRAAVRVRRRFKASTITQDVRLWATSARLEFHTIVDWHDRHWLLKARFPLAVRSTHAAFETAFGVVFRPTYRNTSWDTAQFEVAGHRFADLSEPGYGAALINDGKYGYHCLRGELGLTLLRSPAWPDPRADEGRAEFVYALLPHEGDWLDGGVLMEAEDLNRPLLATEVTAAGEMSWAALRIDGLPLGLGAFKRPEDGEDGLVLRTYEPRGGRGRASVELPPGWRLDSELDLLEAPTGDPDLYFGPFRVHSWLLRLA